jgi:6-phosphogluconolactonase (cycloisomerase 2 family)
VGSPFPGGANLAWVGVHPSGKFLYVDDFGFGAGSTFGYTINGNTGALVRIPGQVAVSQAPDASVFHPNGQFLYVTGEHTNGVLAYSINANSGQLSLVPGSPFPGGFFPESMAIDPTSTFLFAPNFFNANVSGYTSISLLVDVGRWRMAFLSAAASAGNRTRRRDRSHPSLNAQAQFAFPFRKGLLALIEQNIRRHIELLTV